METSIKKKRFTGVEEKFIEAGLLFAEEKDIARVEIAEYLSLILDRTTKSIEMKVNRIATDLGLNTTYRKKKSILVNEVVKDVIPVSQTKVQTQILKSETQIIQSHTPQIEMTFFTPKDVGTRVKVKAYNFKPYGVFCISDEGKSGLLLPSMVSTDYVTKIEDYIALGDEFLVRVEEDRRDPNKTILNAKVIGNVIPLKDRNK